VFPGLVRKWGCTASAQSSQPSPQPSPQPSSKPKPKPETTYDKTLHYISTWGDRLSTIVGFLPGWLCGPCEIAGTVDKRVSGGLSVGAEVTSVHKVGFGRFGGQEATVHYRLGGESYSARLMSVRLLDWNDSTQVELSVEPSDPRRAATADGWVTEDRLVLIPYPVAAVGIVALLLGAIGWIGSRYYKPPPRSLDVGGDGLPQPLVVDFDLPTSSNGYDRASVEALLRRAIRAQITENVDEQRLIAAQMRAPSIPVRRRRGYDQASVDQLFRAMERRLEGFS
jgi:hypothetical protein